MSELEAVLGNLKETSRVWRDPRSGRIYKASRPGEFEAQVILPTDISTIEAKVILDEVLGLARPEYTLRQICRVIAVPQLVMSIDVATKLAGQEKVPPMVEAEVSAQAYSRANFDLWKNVVHVVIADEARKKAAHDLLTLHIEDAARDLARMENKQIATIAETGTEVAGTDWGDVTKNPFNDLTGVITTIKSNGYPADFIAAHPLVWSDFISNPFVKGTLVGVQMPGGNVFPVPGLPGVIGYSDAVLTSTKAIVGSKRGSAVILGDGPTEAAQYRNEPAGFDAYIIRQWLEPKLCLAGAIRVLTGVHA